MYLINKLRDCGIFQGEGKRTHYFEGWYFKHVDKTEKNVLCVIPGVSYGNSPSESHAFVQVMDGRTHKTYYVRYGIGDFSFSKGSFEIRIAGNVFGYRGIKLQIEDKDLHINGELCYSKHINWTSSLLSPNSMGWYAYIPFMECYHGVLSLKHIITGSLSINKDTISFDGGAGYMEKDWGTSFPASWIWLQSNHFQDIDSSAMVSIARIPWRGRNFTGFIAGFWHDGQLYRFTTYTGARIERLEYEGAGVSITLSDKRRLMQVNAVQNDTGELLSPVKGSMAGTVKESVNAAADIHMYDRKTGREIFSKRARCCGMEVAGRLPL